MYNSYDLVFASVFEVDEMDGSLSILMTKWYLGEELNKWIKAGYLVSAETIK